jgi:two-component system chemotaxis response regulator CheB
MSSRKIKVLVVDDSALMRQLLTEILQKDPAIEVIGSAADPYIAREKIKKLKPDVLTLDVEMPGMDGLTFLEKLMRLHPMPVVMISSLTEKGAGATLRALELGAVDFVAKPREGVREGMQTLVDDICSRIHTAALAHVRAPAETSTPLPAPPEPPVQLERVVVMGASAGGTQTIAEILAVLPKQAPGIAIVQHMPPRFTALFASNLNNRCAMDIREARDGDRLTRGVVLIAPGGFQMSVMRDRSGFFVSVYEGAPVNHHCPAVDVLFESAARHLGRDALGILLTGMGSDGARGLLAMKEKGAYTIAQDEASSIIFGMPDQAIKLGAAREVLGMDMMARRILQWAGNQLALPAAPSARQSL